jgi:hypothetical protein
VVDSVPRPMAVVVVLVVCAGPEVRQWVTLVNDVLWRWRREPSDPPDDRADGEPGDSPGHRPRARGRREVGR